MMTVLRRLAIILIIVLFVSNAFAADEILVAAASDLQFALPELAQKFEKQTGVKVNLTFGSSGNFTTQIRNGAPFDLFFSADLNYPRQLAADGLADPATLYHYADGKIVLWAPITSKLDLQRGFNVLLQPGVHKISIANPAHAPYGRAAVAALQHENLYEKVETKLVLGENISQAAQFVQSGNADVGIIALSLALAPSARGKGKYYEVPAADYPPIQQGVVLLKSSAHKSVAVKFLNFLKTPESQALLAHFGFSFTQ
ncbi:MAG TPA: molybdate ABC transporter substrate-binding protein [Terriglobales bacterium]|jgi:molybdate transport system substrate-binding protein